MLNTPATLWPGVQGFFARLLEKDYLRFADPGRGRFRTFLLTSLKAFVAEAHRHSTRLKRGGGNVVMLSYPRVLGSAKAP